MEPNFLKDADGGLQALHFTTDTEKRISVDTTDASYPCLFCNNQFDVKTQDAFLRHLLLDHKFVIAAVNLVAHFPRYISYWKSRLHDVALKDFCSVIKTNSLESDQAPSDYYYLLCDLLPEDKALREQLQRERLEEILELNRREREDKSFSRMCLFCRKQFLGDRQDFFKHMLEDHNFSIGRPDNIVYGCELLDILEGKLKRLQCLYCEKTFRTWEVLKEHMRKKQHKKINPRNSAYDKFYVINYLELGKTWESLESEEDCDPSETEEWDDWTEDGDGLGAVCLFCDKASTNLDSLCSHMMENHGFNLSEIKARLKLDFYQQVKLINYIRRQVLHGKCYGCCEAFANPDELSHHLKDSGHTGQLPDATEWDQPQFFFSTYENDNLLCIIDDGDDDEDSGTSSDVPILAEDITSNGNSVLCEELRSINITHGDE